MRFVIYGLLIAALVAGCGGNSSLTPVEPADPASGSAPLASKDGFALGVLKNASGAPSGVRISWTRVDVSGVQGYYIYRAENSGDLPDGDPAGYESYRIDDGDGDGNKLIEQFGSGTQTLEFDDEFSLDVGDTFYYRITVVNSTSDESDFSSQLNITIAQHEITSITTTAVSIGDTVTITGDYFGQTRDGDQVWFTSNIGTGGYIEADYAEGTGGSWGPTQIVVKVPYGATDGVIGVEVDSVTVYSIDQINYNMPSFTTTGTPVDPDEDWVDHLYITLSGDDFGPASELGNDTHVYFGGTAATDYDTGNSDEQTIKVKVPASAVGIVVDVYVSVADNDSGTESFTLLPHISSLNDYDGNTGDEITLTGTNFGSTQGDGTVSVNGEDAAVTSWNNTTVVITIPASAVDGNIVLTRFDDKVTEGVGFDVIPTLSSFSPSRRVEGEELTISGSGFGDSQGNSKVSFDGGSGVDATQYTSWANNEIVVEVPTGAETGTVTAHIDDTSVGDDSDSATSASNVAIILEPPDIEDIGQL